MLTLLAKVLIGKAVKELIVSGYTDPKVLELAVDKIGNDNGHFDMGDIMDIIASIF